MKKRFVRIISLVLVVTMALEMCGLEVLAAAEATRDAERYVDEGSADGADAMAAGEEHGIDMEEREPASVLYEEEGLREEATKHFRLDDGSYIAVQYETAVHYEDEDGQWEDIDNRLVAAGAAAMPAEAALEAAEANSVVAPIGLYEAENGDNAVRFPARLEDGTLYNVTSGSYGIQLSLGLGMAMPEEGEIQDILTAVTPEPEATEAPEATENPEETETPENTDPPEETEIPETTPEPEVTATPEPETTPEPQPEVQTESTLETVTAEAAYTAESGETGTTPEPETMATPEPEATSTPEPETTPEPEETENPETTPEPEETENPEATETPGGLPIDRPIITFDPSERIAAMLEQAGVAMFNKVTAVVDNHEEDSLASVVAAKTEDTAAVAAEAEAVESTETGDGEEKPSLYEQIKPPHIYSEITYPNVYDGVSLQYELYGKRVKENIIIEKAQEEYSYTFSLNLQNLTPVLDTETGAIHLMDGEEIAYEMPAPYMYDAAGAFSMDVAYGLAEVGNGQYVVVVVADEEWINAEEREFPVTIDPTLENKTESTDGPITGTYVTEGSPNTKHTNYQLMYCGLSSVPETDWCNIYLNVNTLPSIPKNCVIVGAEVALACSYFSYISQNNITVRAYEIDGYKPSGYSSYRSWVQNLTFNTTPYRKSNALDYKTIYASDKGYYIGWNVVRAATKWYEHKGEDANRMLKLEATNLDKNVVVGFRGYGTSSPAYFIVAYRNTVGVESYHTNQAQGVDRAGTSYVSDFTQQMTLVHPDVELSTASFDFSLSHVYNSVHAGLQFTDNVSGGIYTKRFSDKMQVGAGWKLIAQETVYWETINGTSYFVYNDADGTVHYFTRKESSSDIFYDEDGLGLQITRADIGNDAIYTMTDGDKNWSKVFHNGYLISYTDSNGNAIYYTYGGYEYSESSTAWKPTTASNHRLTGIVEQTNNSGAPLMTLATLSYDSDGNLTGITDYAGRTTSYTYDSGKRLTQITHPDGTYASYTYDANGYMTSARDSESGYGLNFAYTKNNTGGYIVSQVTETAGGVTGGGFSVTRESSQKMYYRFFGNDHVSGTSDDILEYSLFDYWGHTICSYTLDSTGKKLYGASSASYTKNSGTSKTNNRITGAAARGIHSQNLLKDSGLEFHSSIGAWSNYSGGGSVTGTTGGTAPHLGYKQIALTGSSGGTKGMQQSVSLTGGTAYTFSGYVNIKSLSPSGTDGGVYLAFLNSSGTVVAKSERVDYNTSSGIENGWEKLHVTYTPGSSGTYAVALYVTQATGTVCGDDFQLEEGSVPSATNLIQGASFDDYNYSTAYWNRNYSDYIYRSVEEVIDGTYSMRLVGVPGGTRWNYQKVYVNQTGAGKTFILSGWSRANSVAYPERTSRIYALYAVFHYTDGTLENHRIDYSYATTDWQYGSLAVVSESPTKTIDYIEVCMSYHYNCNSAFYDDLSLVMEPAQTYSYDDKGNLVSAKDKDGKLSYEYETDTHILKSYTDLAGVKYDLTHYSGTHNLKTTTSAGVTATNSYDTAGNLTQTKTTATGTDKYLLTWSQYSNNGNTLYMEENANGYGYWYGYNTTLWKPRWSQKTEGAKQYYQYTTSTGRVNQTYISGVTALWYGYSAGQISALDRKSFVGEDGVWQRYGLAHDAFGNSTGITVQRGTDGTTWSSGRTLASYAYSGNNGLLSKMSYGNGDYVNYTYDVFGRKTAQTYEDGTGVHYEYSAEGDLVRQYETNASGTTTRVYDFQYDSLGRLIRSRETNGGSLVQRTEHIYDGADRITSQSWQIGNDSYSESYSYDSTDGKLSQMDTATGAKINFTYDPLKRLTTETTTANGSTLFTKNYSYRDSTSSDRTTLQVTEVNYKRGNSSLTGYAYTYNAAGNIASEKDTNTDVTTTYTYGTQGELLKAALSSGTTYTYTYDTAGNIRTSSDGTTTHTYAYNDSDWADLLTSYDGHSLTYDEIGNPTSYYNGTSHTMSWEKGRRLTSVTINGRTTTYEYDSDGIRTSKTVNGQRTDFVTQNGKVVRQTTGGTVVDYIYDAQQRPYAMTLRETSTSTPVTYYYLLNLQGDVVGMADASGNVVVTYDYDPWGRIINMGDSSVECITLYNCLCYRGYYWDSETDFYYLQSRYYDPELGRFINADSLVITDISLECCNLFSYCGNNPVNYSDPSGMKCNWVFNGIEYFYDGSASDFLRLNQGLPPKAYVKAVNDHYNKLYGTTSITSNYDRGTGTTTTNYNFSSKENAKDFVYKHYNSDALDSLRSLGGETAFAGAMAALDYMEKMAPTMAPSGIFLPLMLNLGMSIGLELRNASRNYMRDSSVAQIDNMSSEKVTVVITVWRDGGEYLSVKEWR